MNAAIFWSFEKELKFFQTKTGSVVFDVQVKIAASPIPSIKLYAGPLSQMLVKTSE